MDQAATSHPSLSTQSAEQSTQPGAKHLSDLQARPFRHYLKAHPRAFMLGIVALFCTNLCDVLTPLTIKAGIDALQGHQQPRLLMAVLSYAGLMAGVTIFRYAWRIFFGRFHHSVAEDLRNKIFEKLSLLGPGFYQKTSVGELMSLITNDVNTFRMAIGPGFLILIDALFYISMILPVMFYLSFDWTWKTLMFLPAVPFFIRRLESLIHVRFRAQQDRLSEMSGKAQEIVSGIRPIKSFAQETNQTAAFNDQSRKFELACNSVAKVDSAFNPVMQFAVTLGSVVLLFFCTSEVMRGAITLGTFVAFHEYIKRMVWPMSAIGMGSSMVEQGRASFDRIRDLLGTETDIPDSGTIKTDHFASIEVRNLTFRYEGATADALKNIHFKLHAGETLGIVGPVGSGKTTVLQLLCRLYSAPPQTIFLNGIEIENISRASLSQTISLVPQDAFLFSDTISENVALGIENFPGLEPIQDAASTVNMDHEIEQIPLSYAAHIGERGVNLSGGQKQRLTIARALIRRSPLVMFDDSLSAVDAKTEQTIVAELKAGRARHADQAVILVSHRLATLKHADRIIVLNHGEVEAQGTHHELLEKSSTYRHLSMLQSSTVEDASIWDSINPAKSESAPP